MPTPYWFNVIRRAVTRRNKGQTPFSQEHVDRAKDWVTCACGKQDQRIERSDFGCPVDYKLATAGSRFYDAVVRQDPKLAREILDKIEVRASELLRGLEEN